MAGRLFFYFNTDDEPLLIRPPYREKFCRDWLQIGTRFIRSYTDWSLCAPSRISVLKGQSALITQVITNNTPGGYFAYQNMESNALPVWLHGAGVKVFHIGKFMNSYDRVTGRYFNDSPPHADGAPIGTNPDHIPPGYDDWFVVSGDEDYNDLTWNDNGTQFLKPGYYKQYMQTRVLALLDSIDPDDDVCFFIWPHAPHDPQVPEDIYQDVDGDPITKDVPFPIRPNYNELDRSDKAQFTQDKPGVDFHNLENAFQKGIATLFSVDDLVEAVRQKVTDLGRMDDAEWLYTSDNGLSLGAHAYANKENIYIEGAYVPFVYVRPDVAGGKTSEELICNLDITATICDYFGVTPPYALNGRSVRPLVKNRNTPWRTLMFAGASPDDDLPVIVYGIIHGRYTLHEFNQPAPDGIQYELFDLRIDPYELNNVYSDPAYAAVATAMVARLNFQKTATGADMFDTTVIPDVESLPDIETLVRSVNEPHYRHYPIVREEV